MQRGIDLIVFLCAVFGSGCAAPKPGLFPSQNSKTVYVLHRGMHTPLVVRREDIPTNIWPAHTVLPETEFIEIGWGDSEGYRFEWTFRMVTRALFWPTPSVIFMQGFDEPVTDHFSGRAREIIKVDLSDEGFARMCTYFQNSFERDEQGQPILLGDDFYVAKDSYHIFHNSNHWAAEGLRAAGCPITPFYAINANNVMFQTRRFGDVIWRR